MNVTKTHAFLKEWRQLAADRKSLDYREARWCYNLRAEFPSGDAGDKAFFHWLDTELCVPPKEREAQLDKARAFKIVPDQATWDAQGANAAVKLRPLVRMPKKEQVAILGASKVEGKSVDKVILERDRAQTARTTTPVSAHVRGIGAPGGDTRRFKSWVIGLSAETVLDALAEQIADGILAAPLFIQDIAKRRAAVLRGARQGPSARPRRPGASDPA